MSSVLRREVFQSVGLDQAHTAAALAGAQWADMQPVVTTECHRPDSVFDVVIVDG